MIDQPKWTKVTDQATINAVAPALLDGAMADIRSLLTALEKVRELCVGVPESDKAIRNIKYFVDQVLQVYRK